MGDLLERVTDKNPRKDFGGGTDSMASPPEGRAVTITRARVVDVNIRDYTIDVRTEHTGKVISYLPFLSPYCHPAMGEGINFMPEVGSVCWYCEPTDSGVFGIVLGWTMPEEIKNAYRGGRALLNPGDLHFSTRDGNFIYVRRGGIVQIGATPICQTIYIPVRNTIQQFAENYKLNTPGGDLTWTVARKDDQQQGYKATTFLLAAHEFADDPIKDPVALLKIGSHGSGNPTILTLQTRDRGGGAVKTKLEITKAGEVTWTVEKAVTFDFKDDFAVLVGKKFSVHAHTDIQLLADANVDVQGAQVTAKAGGSSMSLTSGAAALDGPAVNLGAAQAQVVTGTPTFDAWVQAVNAALLGGGVGVPLVGVQVPLPAPYKSDKVKA